MNVDYSFDVILRLYEIYFNVELFRAVIFVVAIWITSKKYKKVLGWILNVCLLNDLFGIACIIILMAARWSPQGRLCSGDFLYQLTSTRDNQEVFDIIWDSKFVKYTFLLERGQYLRGLTVYVWVWGGL